LKRNYLIKTDKEIGKLLERNWKCIKSKRFFENLIKDKNKFLDIQDIKNVITKNDGKLISKKYLGYTIKLKIKCKNNHIFKCCPDKLIQGRWCPYCKFLKLKKLFQFTIRDMQNIAKNRGGKCLSEKYKNAHKKLKWECANKHQWYAPYCKISIDQWCPQCHTFIREERCREIFEKIFNNKFPKIRPSWLISPKGFRMELDGYCKRLRIAFEHNGLQHYKPRGNGNLSFKDRKIYDKSKRRLCKKNKIGLIIVPYSIRFELISDFIISKLIKQNLIK
jgi:hypothetical protein